MLDYKVDIIELGPTDFVLNYGELGNFSVDDCAATVPADIKVVHGYIHEQHGGLHAFNQLVRTKVRSSVDF